MADTDFDTLLDRLAERTAAGTVNWKMTSRDDEFVIYFQKFALTMRHGFDEDGDEYVTFSLRNEAGKKIDEYWVFKNKYIWDKAFEIWSSGRRRALRIDEAIEGLIAELDSKDIVGEDKSTMNDEETDFPF